MSKSNKKTPKNSTKSTAKSQKLIKPPKGMIPAKYLQKVGRDIIYNTHLPSLEVVLPHSNIIANDVIDNFLKHEEGLHEKGQITIHALRFVKDKNVYSELQQRKKTRQFLNIILTAEDMKAVEKLVYGAVSKNLLSMEITQKKAVKNITERFELLRNAFSFATRPSLIEKTGVILSHPQWYIKRELFEAFHVDVDGITSELRQEFITELSLLNKQTGLFPPRTSASKQKSSIEELVDNALELYHDRKFLLKFLKLEEFKYTTRNMLREFVNTIKKTQLQVLNVHLIANKKVLDKFLDKLKKEPIKNELIDSESHNEELAREILKVKPSGSKIMTLLKTEETPKSLRERKWKTIKAMKKEQIQQTAQYSGRKRAATQLMKEIHRNLVNIELMGLDEQTLREINDKILGEFIEKLDKYGLAPEGNNLNSQAESIIKSKRRYHDLIQKVMEANVEYSKWEKLLTDVPTPKGKAEAKKRLLEELVETVDYLVDEAMQRNKKTKGDFKFVSTEVKKMVNKGIVEKPKGVSAKLVTTLLKVPNDYKKHKKMIEQEVRNELKKSQFGDMDGISILGTFVKRVLNAQRNMLEELRIQRIAEHRDEKKKDRKQRIDAYKKSMGDSLKITTVRGKSTEDAVKLLQEIRDKKVSTMDELELVREVNDMLSAISKTLSPSHIKEGISYEDIINADKLLDETKQAIKGADLAGKDYKEEIGRYQSLIEDLKGDLLEERSKEIQETVISDLSVIVETLKGEEYLKISQVNVALDKIKAIKTEIRKSKTPDAVADDVFTHVETKVKDIAKNLKEKERGNLLGPFINAVKKIERVNTANPDMVIAAKEKLENLVKSSEHSQFTNLFTETEITQFEKRLVQSKKDAKEKIKQNSMRKVREFMKDLQVEPTKETVEEARELILHASAQLKEAPFAGLYEKVADELSGYLNSLPELEVKSKTVLNDRVTRTATVAVKSLTAAKKVTPSLISNARRQIQIARTELEDSPYKDLKKALWSDLEKLEVAVDKAEKKAIKEETSKLEEFINRKVKGKTLEDMVSSLKKTENQSSSDIEEILAAINEMKNDVEDRAEFPEATVPILSKLDNMLSETSEVKPLKTEEHENLVEFSPIVKKLVESREIDDMLDLIESKFSHVMETNFESLANGRKLLTEAVNQIDNFSELVHEKNWDYEQTEEMKRMLNDFNTTAMREMTKPRPLKPIANKDMEIIRQNQFEFMEAITQILNQKVHSEKTEDGNILIKVTNLSRVVKDAVLMEGGKFIEAHGSELHRPHTDAIDALVPLIIQKTHEILKERKDAGPFIPTEETEDAW